MDGSRSWKEETGDAAELFCLPDPMACARPSSSARDLGTAAWATGMKSPAAKPRGHTRRGAAVAATSGWEIWGQRAQSYGSLSRKVPPALLVSCKPCLLLGKHLWNSCRKLWASLCQLCHPHACCPGHQHQHGPLQSGRKQSLFCPLDPFASPHCYVEVDLAVRDFSISPLLVPPAGSLRRWITAQRGSCHHPVPWRW